MGAKFDRKNGGSVPEVKTHLVFANIGECSFALTKKNVVKQKGNI